MKLILLAAGMDERDGCFDDYRSWYLLLFLFLFLFLFFGTYSRL